MNDGTLFFETKTIGLSKYGGRKPQTLLDAARHNRRQIQAELGARGHIDPTRSRLNQTIAGPATPEEVVELAVALMTGAGVAVAKMRKDYTQAQELLFSLPVNTTIDVAAYFADCLVWAVGKFGRDTILSADIHLDEAAPHLHVLLAPIAEGRHLGSKLITRFELAKLRESFAALAWSYGLREPTRRLHGARRELAAQAVLAHLESTQDAALKSALWSVFKAGIESNPARCVARLGIELPAVEPIGKKPRTTAQIFTSAGKGPKIERTRKPIGFGIDSPAGSLKPIGFEVSHGVAPEKTETIALLVSPVKPPGDGHQHGVGIEGIGDMPTIAIPPFEGRSKQGRDVTRRATDMTMETTRDRDGDHAAGQWCDELGEFITTRQNADTLPTRAARQAADRWVASRLADLGKAS